MRQRLQEFFNSIDLKKKYPGYFDVRIFRIIFIIMFLFVVYDFYLNDFSFYNFSYECKTYDGKDCMNTLYDCANLPFYNQLNKDNYCTVYSQYDDKRLCAKYNICDNLTIPNGFKIGREDNLSKDGKTIFGILIFMAFFFNHLKYYLKTGKLLPQRAE